ncbi:glycosyltransferase family 4 protein [Methylobacterium dankookense]|nr:glycosyltransferase family 4 protein [Methylobacterium dankookense]
MRHYRHLLSEHYDNVHCLGTKYLDSKISVDNKIERFFDFYYNEFINVLSSDIDPVGLTDTHETRKLLAERDIGRLLSEYQFDQSDAIFFPSIDIYSLMGLSAHRSELSSDQSPKLLLRFIGVMENAAPAYRKPLSVALMHIRGLITAGCNISISAETPAYADWLARELDLCVHVTPYGETREPLPLPETSDFHVVCPGSARIDKGFLRLESIFRQVRILDPDINIRFTTQCLPDREITNYQTYLAKLYACPGVSILPSSLSNDEIDSLYLSSDLILLPYDANIYKFRGSAVLMESASIGRPVVTLDGSAFSDQVSYYGLGLNCSDNLEIARRIVEYSQTPKSVRWRQSIQARSRFITDMLGVYRNWVN